MTDTDRFERALLALYDQLPGPTLAALDKDTQDTLLFVARRRRTLGRGRVTNPDLDQRIQKARLRREASDA